MHESFKGAEIGRNKMKSLVSDIKVFQKVQGRKVSLKIGAGYVADFSAFRYCVADWPVYFLNSILNLL